MLRFVYYTIIFSMTCVVLTLLGCRQSPMSSVGLKDPMRYLRINLPGEPPTLDPRKGGDVYSSAMHFLLFEGLTTISPDSSADYGLAHRIDISSDKLTYTFHLRDAQWSDGTPITADDFVYSWTSMLAPLFPCPNANLLYPILNAEEAKKGLISLDQVGIQAINDHILRVDLKAPTPYFLNLISFCVFFPVPKHVAMHNPSWADQSNIVCNGPYYIADWKRDCEFTLKKNPSYWDAEDITLQGLKISLITHENTALEMFAKQELDILGAPYTGIPIDAAESLKDKNLLESFPVGKTYITAFNTTREPFNNKHIRQALSLAIDRKGLVSSLLLFDEIPALNFIPPALKQGKNEPFIPEEATPELAKWHLEEGLKELGLSKEVFKGITLLYHRQDLSHKIAQALQHQWKKHLDLDIALESLDTQLFFTRINTSEFDICQSYWVAQYDDPMNILDRFKYASNPKNYANWEDQEYIQLLEESAYLDKEQRLSVLEKAEQIILEDMPIAPLFHGSRVYMVQPYIKGIYTSSIGSVHLHKIYFEEKQR